MFSPFQIAIKYLQYYITASNGKGHGIHSPFIFEFISKVLNDTTQYPAYDTVEKLRAQLMQDETILTIEDHGAGSSLSATNQRTISSIAKNAAKPKKFGQLLYRMVKQYQPESILELGTSLGITTSYLASANQGSTITTLEGAPQIAARARQHFGALQFQNIHVTEGNFDDTLSPVLQQLSTVDLAFIDGNHRQEPTERYFRQILPHTHNDTILIFDDIHWSRDMEQAWKTIQANRTVRCTIDLFFIGIVLFRQEFKEKQGFVIRF